jgi:hypothetical protein
LDAEHNKAGKMATGNANVIQVIKTKAKLRADQRICRRLQFPCDTVRLETINASSNIINVFPPSCNDRVPLDWCARHVGSSKGTFKPSPGVPERVSLSFLAEFFTDSHPLTNEMVLTFASGISTKLNCNKRIIKNIEKLF